MADEAAMRDLDPSGDWYPMGSLAGDEHLPVPPGKLTEDERRYLAMHARYEAERQLDARNYATGKIHPEGGQMLDERWHTRQERHDRWRAIADGLHRDPWGTDG